MILNIIILWVLILILSGVLWFLYKWYKQEQQEQDERILQLEKRIEEVKSIDKKRGQILDEAIGENIKEFCELESRIQKLERKKKSDKE